jgi:hypothetical protein
LELRDIELNRNADRRILPVIFFILIPIFSSLLYVSDLNYNSLHGWIVNPIIFSFGSLDFGAYSFPLYVLAIDFFEIIITLAYAVYPVIYYPHRKFQSSVERMITEYRYILKILYIEIALALAVNLYNFLIFSERIVSFAHVISPDMGLFLIQLGPYLVISVAGCLIWIFTLVIRKQFRYYLQEPY